jgi:spore coat polysaccharide biosynthesis protein SpsF
VIVGERVLLRPLDERDTDDVLRWRAEPGTLERLFGEVPPTRDEHQAWLARMRAQGDRQEFVIVDRDADRAVGTIGLSHIDRRYRRAEYGVLIGEPAARGRGIAREASRLLLDHAFGSLGLHRVYLHVFPDNEPALRLYRRLGFRLEGRLRDHVWKGGRFRDVVVMGLVRRAGRVVAAIQARMGSTRLPGKVLRPIAGRPVIERIAERLAHCRELDEVVVATSVEPRDDAVAALAGRLGLRCVRGSEHDLVERIVLTASSTDADAVVRITADCPLVDPGLVDRVVQRWRESGGALDYVSNVFPATYPDGLDVELITRATLERLERDAREPSFRDAPTSYIWAHPAAFRIANVAHDANLRGLRWTLDYPEDLAFIDAVFRELGRDDVVFTMREVLDLLRRRPELRELNRHLEVPA